MAVSREEMLATAEAITENVSLRLLLESLSRLAQPVIVPPPVVTIPPPDLSAVVTAVNGLKPGVDADEIARAIVKVIAPIMPSGDGGTAVALEAVTDALKKLEFRMRGQVPAFGASGPSNISDNPNRLLGIVSVNPIGPIPNTTRLLDYAGRTDANPVYIGQAPQGTVTSALVWQVQKLSYDNSARLTEQEYLTGISWDGRVSAPW